MPFLRQLVREVTRRAAQDPRVRETAKKLFEDEIRPRAQSAWEKAKPEVEAAWEMAKPEVEAAKKRAMAEASNIADRVKRGIEESRKPREAPPPSEKDSA